MKALLVIFLLQQFGYSQESIRKFTPVFSLSLSYTVQVISRLILQKISQRFKNQVLHSNLRKQRMQKRLQGNHSRYPVIPERRKRCEMAPNPLLHPVLNLCDLACHNADKDLKESEAMQASWPTLCTLGSELVYCYQSSLT